jgi:hypothetical protein
MRGADGRGRNRVGGTRRSDLVRSLPIFKFCISFPILPPRTCCPVDIHSNRMLGLSLGLTYRGAKAKRKELRNYA